MKRYHARLLIGIFCFGVGLTIDEKWIAIFGAYMFGLGVGESPDDEND